DEERDRPEGSGSDREIDHLVRPLRIPRVACGELRLDRVCQRIYQGPPSCGVLRLSAQRLADGLLSPGDIDQGRAAPRRDRSSGGREPLRLEVPLGRRWRAPRTSLREGIAGSDGQVDRIGATICLNGRSRASVPTARRSTHEARLRRCAGIPWIETPRRAMAGRAGCTITRRTFQWGAGALAGVA